MKKTYHLSFKVPFQYNVHFTRNVFAHDNSVLANVFSIEKFRAAFFVDDGLVVHWPGLPDDIARWCEAFHGQVELVAPVQLVSGGEQIKNGLEVLDRVGQLAADARLCRHSHVVIVGGGAVLDAVGYAAATVHRGIRQVRVPTTVLSQADSGVGVKNGLNRFGIKNFYGSFVPPAAVINDAAFLQTLARRDWISGVAEAFKVAIIKDRAFLSFLSERSEALLARDLEVMEAIVGRTAHLHLDHIRDGGDPFETGSARPLDFGHWAAHRLEAMTDYGLRHGEAVAIGIALDLGVALGLGLLRPDEYDWACGTMESCGLVLWDPALERRSETGDLEILGGIEQFREHLGGRLAVTLPDGLGARKEINELPENLVIESIVKLRKRRDARREPTATSPVA